MIRHAFNVFCKKPTQTYVFAGFQSESLSNTTCFFGTPSTNINGIISKDTRTTWICWTFVASRCPRPSLAPPCLLASRSRPSPGTMPFCATWRGGATDMASRCQNGTFEEKISSVKGKASFYMWQAAIPGHLINTSFKEEWWFELTVVMETKWPEKQVLHVASSHPRTLDQHKFQGGMMIWVDGCYGN